MPTLLHIDSSPLYETSITRVLTDAFETEWRASRPDTRVIQRDLNGSRIPPITAEWISAAFTPQDLRTPAQSTLLFLSETLIAEIEEADEYVMGVPMHNFGVPSVMKLWIDQITRVDRTFSYTDGPPKGRLVGKKVTVIVATGSVRGANPQAPSFNFVEPYLRTLFDFIGVTDSTFLTAGGTGALDNGRDRHLFLESHLQAARAHALR